MNKSKTLVFHLSLMILLYSCINEDSNIFSDDLSGKNSKEWIIPPTNFIDHPDYGKIYFLKCDSIRLNTPAPWVGNQTWTNHQIEFEVMLTEKTGFVGFDYNMQNKPDYGCNFHFSAFRDTVNLQSMGMWGNNKGSWKLWPISQNKLALNLNEWIKFRIEVGNKFANIYANDTCIYTIYDTPFSSGGIRFWTSYYGGAYYRNIKVVKLNNEQIKPKLKDDWEKIRQVDLIKNWKITTLKSDTFAQSVLPSQLERDSLIWTNVVTDERGVLNLGAIYPDYNKSSILAKTYLETEKDKEIKCFLTYTDRFSLFLNGKKVFNGPDRNWWNPEREKYGNSRLIPDQFEITLQLKKGRNELLVRSEVMEDFGWGFWLRTN